MGGAHPGAARCAEHARDVAAARRRLRPRALVLGALRRALRGSAPRMRHAAVSARRLALFGAAAGLLCIAFILLFAGAPRRVDIFHYLLRTQDLPGAVLVTLIALPPPFPPLAPPRPSLPHTNRPTPSP